MQGEEKCIHIHFAIVLKKILSAQVMLYIYKIKKQFCKTNKTIYKELLLDTTLLYLLCRPQPKTKPQRKKNLRFSKRSRQNNSCEENGRKYS